MRFCNRIFGCLLLVVCFFSFSSSGGRVRGVEGLEKKPFLFLRSGESTVAAFNHAEPKKEVDGFEGVGEERGEEDRGPGAAGEGEGRGEGCDGDDAGSGEEGEGGRGEEGGTRIFGGLRAFSCDNTF